MRIVAVLIAAVIVTASAPVSATERVTHPVEVWIPMDPMGLTIAVYEATAAPVVSFGESSVRTLTVFHNITFGALAIIELLDGSEHTAPIVETYNDANDTLFELMAIFPDVDLTLAGEYRFKRTDGNVTIEYALPVPAQAGPSECIVVICNVERPNPNPITPAASSTAGTSSASSEGGYCTRFQNDIYFGAPHMERSVTGGNAGVIFKGAQIAETRVWAFRSSDGGNSGNWDVSYPEEGVAKFKLGFSVYGKTNPGGDLAPFALALATYARGLYSVSYLCPGDPATLVHNSAYQPRVGIARVANHALNWPDDSIRPASSRKDTSDAVKQSERIAIEALKSFAAGVSWYVSAAVNVLLSQKSYGSKPYYAQTFDGTLDEMVWKYNGGGQNEMTVEITEYLEYCGGSRAIEFYGAYEASQGVWLNNDKRTPGAYDMEWFGIHENIAITAPGCNVSS